MRGRVNAIRTFKGLVADLRIMVQDTYKWVLQVYFICSTFVANKKIFQWQGSERKTNLFVENLYVDVSTLSWCIFFL